MERLKKIVADAVFVIQILIIFVLLFENRILLPAVLQSFGRMHPLLLHLPIGLLIVTVVLFYSVRYFEGKGVESLSKLLIHFTSLTASLTTLMGLFLSLEGGFGSDQLWLHKWLGVALSFYCWGLLAVSNNIGIMKPAGLAGVILLVLTGHYGANLTHGEDFVWAPLYDREVDVVRVITDSTALFTATIEPIFEAKCYGCHNPKKAKGNLVLTTMEGIVKGGESGPLWRPEDAEHSLIVQRLLLPLNHDDHMPPKDKAQLAVDEITLIAAWIDDGANFKTKLKEVAADDTLAKLASLIIPRYQQTHSVEQKYEFEFISPERIRKLSRPNRSVFQIAKNEPAIQADFFLRESYDSKYLKELIEVKEQLISLNLSRMPAKDSDLDIISKFINLEVLNLNNTEITGRGLAQLARLPRLRSLSLSGTSVETGALRKLATSESLEEVFIWNTGVSSADVESLIKDFPHLFWNIGFIPDETEVLTLNPPLTKNKSRLLKAGETVVLGHNLPGTRIQYTFDGTDPDSVSSPDYDDEIAVGNYAVIKARAFKAGWRSSDVVEFFFFRKGIQPDSAHLETTPDERFQGEGTITLFDGKQGLPDFYRHPAWMAFKESDLVLSFSFEKDIPTIRNVTLSHAHNSYSICLPPDEMQLWGGNDPANLKLLAKIDPPEVPRPEKPRIEGFTMDVPPSEYKHYRLVAKPARKIADNSRKRPLWLMVDEVFIN